MMTVKRILLYAWLLIGFPSSYFLLLDFTELGTAVLLITWIGGAIFMGFLGDAILFGKGTFFGHQDFNRGAKVFYLSFIILIPLAAMMVDLFKA